jgi:hypothetical protein
MRCYFLRDGHIAGVEVLPLGLSDEDANREGPRGGGKTQGLVRRLRGLGSRPLRLPGGPVQYEAKRRLATPRYGPAFWRRLGRD